MHTPRCVRAAMTQHGRTDGAIALSCNPNFHDGLPDPTEGWGGKIVGAGASFGPPDAYTHERGSSILISKDLPSSFECKIEIGCVN